MSDVACRVCSVYNKMWDMSDIGLMLGARGGGVKMGVQKPTQEKNKGVGEDQANMKKLEKIRIRKKSS